ncbi:hypothetical protein PP479_02085 [Pseudomonas aeruginosa]|uniref:hypothetical protein n=1 Tax=Pseudomonas aeruginosa TaxID=287 RepID=UPI002B264379|nr:hypothetical protein [Pseudomonas aeruginosa]WOX95351.1 hypothetical protein PP479_02085 [Pseudomonas aeruginosa]HBN8651917.1 hypothetical protein [Pseudomonas aeruginosa]HCE0322393.1 hypothetical protein [Pseudomonas aeruginosa]HCE3951677.1 hypothetical protein [Pseudomonas aeruginosa]
MTTLTPTEIIANAHTLIEDAPSLTMLSVVQDEARGVLIALLHLGTIPLTTYLDECQAIRHLAGKRRTQLSVDKP